jgi:hypothetical protein
MKHRLLICQQAALMVHGPHTRLQANTAMRVLPLRVFVSHGCRISGPLQRSKNRVTIQAHQEKATPYES